MHKIFKNLPFHFVGIHALFHFVEIFALQASKGNKDAKRNISMHYKTSLTIIRLDLMSYCNMDGRHKTTDTIKKRRLEAPKCAQPLSVRSNFSLEVSLCSNIQVFSVGKPWHITSTREGWNGSVNWWYMLTVNWQKIGFLRLLCQHFWKIIFRFKVMKPGFQKVIVVNLSLEKLDLNLPKHFSILSIFLV